MAQYKRQHDEFMHQQMAGQMARRSSFGQFYPEAWVLYINDQPDLNLFQDCCLQAKLQSLNRCIADLVKSNAGRTVMESNC